MSQPDQDQPKSDLKPPELEPTTIIDSGGFVGPEKNPGPAPTTEEGEPDPHAETRISPVNAQIEIEEHRFSPGDDTFSAVEDLGLRLQSVADENVIGRMDHYNIMRCLGRGGMGTVFEAFDTKLFRPVAIKFMASSLAASPKARGRFLREARVAASINHPNVVTIHAVDEYDGRPYLVMEFVSGTTLHHHLRIVGPLRLGDILRISRQIATGLRAAHEKGIVHRDIKPGNILLENGIHRVKIVDFGLAQVIFDVSDITSMGQTLGTPRYMSPGQIEGSRVDERADLFSLGCVIYMMCVGHPPFAGNSITVLHNILRDMHVPVREVKPEIPAALSDLIDSLLVKSWEQRIQTAAQVEEMLTEISRGGTPSDEEFRGVKEPRQTAAAPVPAASLSPPSPSRPGHSWIGISAAAAIASVFIGWIAWGLGVRPEFPPKGSSDAGLLGANQLDTHGDNTSEAEILRGKGRDPMTLTVGGQEADFQSMQDALDNVQNGDTLNIVGQLPSDDTVFLNDPDRHSNLTILWKTSDVWEWSGAGGIVVSIDSVPGVRIDGARIRAGKAHLLSVHGNCPGLVVENCRLEQVPNSQQAVVFYNASSGSEESPIQMRHCEIVFFELGIACVGSNDTPVEWIQMTDNIIRGLQSEKGVAIILENSVNQFGLQHNRIASVREGFKVVGAWNNTQASNNTFFDVSHCFEAQSGVRTGAVEIVGNLAIQCDEFAAGLSPNGGGMSFAFNKSDSSYTDSRFAASVKGISFVSTEASNPDFMQPKANDQLKVSTAPNYAGALEPRE